MMHRPSHRKVSLALAAALTVAAMGLAACSQQQGPESPAAAAKADPQSLYVRLGGHGTIRKIVDDFAVRLAADVRLNKHFAGINMMALKEKLVGQLGELCGGPEVYTGKDMKTAHRGMGISEMEWNAFIDDLTQSLAAAGVPEVQKQELLVKLSPMKSDIVGQ